jgi:hypothetical protein
MTHQRKTKVLFNIFVVIVGLVALINAPWILLFGLGAILTQGILGPGSGKIGGAIMSKWKAINYIRGYAIPSNPNSDLQSAQRAHFKSIVQFAQKLMVALIPQAWDPFYDKMSGFNAIVKDNFDDYILSDEPTVNTIFSKGTLEPINSLVGSYNSGSGNTIIDWNGDVVGNGLATDLIFGVIVDRSTNLSVFQGQFTGVTRTTESKTLTLPLGLTATNLICGVFPYRGTGVDYIQANNVNDILEAGI